MHAFLELHQPSRSCSCSLSRTLSLSVSLSLSLPPFPPLSLALFLFLSLSLIRITSVGKVRISNVLFVCSIVFCMFYSFCVSCFFSCILFFFGHNLHWKSPCFPCKVHRCNVVCLCGYVRVCFCVFYSFWFVCGLWCDVARIMITLRLGTTCRLPAFASARVYLSVNA